MDTVILSFVHFIIRGIVSLKHTHTNIHSLIQAHTRRAALSCTVYRRKKGGYHPSALATPPHSLTAPVRTLDNTRLYNAPYDDKIDDLKN